MCRTGCNVTVVAPRYRQQYHFDHLYRILRYGNPFRGSGRIGINFVSAIFALVKAYHENPFDVLHQDTLGDCNLCHNLFPKVAGSIESLKDKGSLKKKATMDQCVDCHKNKEDKDKKSGPTSCKGCHKK